MRRDSSSPEAYRADVQGPLRELLESIRQVILEVVPETRETIGHGMLDDPGLANLAAQKVADCSTTCAALALPTSSDRPIPRAPAAFPC